MSRGLVKLAVVHRALALRAASLVLRRGGRGAYGPLLLSGPAAEHGVAFSRGGDVVTVVTRWPLALEQEGGWRDSSLALPAGHWADALSGAPHHGHVLVKDLRRGLPVALLERVRGRAGPKRVGAGMVMLEVWAPGRQRVEVVLEGHRRLAMAKGDRGWWHLDCPGGRRRPVPVFTGRRAGPPGPTVAWQPKGVDGPSVVVDHGPFDWTDRDWHGAGLSDAVLYELHVGTFSPEGTFEGVAPGSGTSSNWVSTPSSCSPWSRPAVAGAGVTTGPTCGRPITSTEARAASSGW